MPWQHVFEAHLAAVVGCEELVEQLLPHRGWECLLPPTNCTHCLLAEHRPAENTYKLAYLGILLLLKPIQEYI